MLLDIAIDMEAGQPFTVFVIEQIYVPGNPKDAVAVVTPVKGVGVHE